MLRNRRAALQELSNQEHFLSKLNEELMRTIQDMEDSTALSVREMLHQQDTLAVRPSPALGRPLLLTRGRRTADSQLSQLGTHPGVPLPRANRPREARAGWPGAHARLEPKMLGNAIPALCTTPHWRLSVNGCRGQRGLLAPRASKWGSVTQAAQQGGTEPGQGLFTLEVFIPSIS